MEHAMELPFSVQRIDHVVFRVRDLSRSIAFYRSVLGCEVVRRREHLGLVHLRAGASMIDLVSVDGALGARGGEAPGEGRAMSITCACASSRSTRRPSSPTCIAMESPRWARRSSISAPKATDCRCTSPIRTAT